MKLFGTTLLVLFTGYTYAASCPLYINANSPEAKKLIFDEVANKGYLVVEKLEDARSVLTLNATSEKGPRPVLGAPGSSGTRSPVKIASLSFRSIDHKKASSEIQKSSSFNRNTKSMIKDLLSLYPNCEDQIGTNECVEMGGIAFASKDINVSDASIKKGSMVFVDSFSLMGAAYYEVKPLEEKGKAIRPFEGTDNNLFTCN